jgi:PAS domain S-box-containing protein
MAPLLPPRSRISRSVWSTHSRDLDARGCLIPESIFCRSLYRSASRPFNSLASQAGISLQNTQLYRDLADREWKIRRLVDADILGIFIWNFEGAIIGANQAFLRMVQYGREDLLSGRVCWTDLTPTEWRERAERAVTELKGTGTVQPYEKEYFRKDGSHVPVLVGGALKKVGTRVSHSCSI